MKFKNTTGQKIKVRINTDGLPIWKTIDPNDTVDLPFEYGTSLGFEPIRTTTGYIGDTKVETKQASTDGEEYFSQLISVKGIGRKTARDIADVYPTLSSLKSAIANKEELPFRDDVSKKLKKAFG